MAHLWKRSPSTTVAWVQFLDLWYQMWVEFVIGSTLCSLLRVLRFYSTKSNIYISIRPRNSRQEKPPRVMPTAKFHRHYYYYLYRPPSPHGDEWLLVPNNNLKTIECCSERNLQQNWTKIVNYRAEIKSVCKMVNFQYWRHFFLSLVEGCHAKEVSQGWSAWVTETVTQFFFSRQLTNRWKVVNLTKEPHFCVWFIWIEVKMRKRMDVVGTSLQNCQMSVPHPLSVRNTVYWLSVITSALFLHSFQSRFLENVFQTKNCPKNCFWYSTIFFA